MSAETLTEAFERVLGEHEMIPSAGRNLGQYRIEYDCACGSKFIADGHAGISGYEAHRAHLAAVLTSAARGREALTLGDVNPTQSAPIRGGSDRNGTDELHPSTRNT